jgi:hypothetical protein
VTCISTPFFAIDEIRLHSINCRLLQENVFPRFCTFVDWSDLNRHGVGVSHECVLSSAAHGLTEYLTLRKRSRQAIEVHIRHVVIPMRDILRGYITLAGETANMSRRDTTNLIMLRIASLENYATDGLGTIDYCTSKLTL